MKETQSVFQKVPYRLGVTILVLLVGLWMYPSELASFAFTAAIMGVFFTIELLIPITKQQIFMRAMFTVFFMVVLITTYVAS